MNIDGSLGNKYQGVQLTRPYDFGTDAIERQRVSLGQSLIDADFEYGLQATKWQTYSDIRKIPSFFEIAGTDIPVSTITSDCQNPSTITVNTPGYASNVNFYPQPGSAVSLQSILASSNGINYGDRAQGYFLVTN
jgi:hypothetical protein